MEEKLKVKYLELIQKQMNVNHWISASGVLATLIMVGYYLTTTHMFGGFTMPSAQQHVGVFNGFGVVILAFFMWFFSAFFWDRANRYRGLYEKVAKGDPKNMTLEVGRVSQISGLATLWSLPVGWFYLGAIIAIILPIIR